MLEEYISGDAMRDELDFTICEECKKDFNTDVNGKFISYHLMGSELCWECFVEWRA